MFDKFRDIEQKYSVEDIYYDNEQVWSYLRNTYFNSTIENISEDYTKETKEGLLTKLYRMIKQSLYGFRNWFGRYDYIFFSDSQERILVEGLYVDKSLEKIIETHGAQKCLMIETPVSQHKPIEKVSTKRIVSSTLLNLFLALLSRFILLFKSKQFTIDILEQLNQREEFLVDYQRIILQFNIRKYLYKIFFRLYHPKAIYINCYYGKQEIICAANELHIQTIEVQHGLIGKEHYAYNPYKKLEKKFFPNTLLTYGDYDKEIVSSNLLSPFSDVISVGSYGLELLKKTAIPPDLQNLVKQYQKTVSISTQYPVENELALFIKAVAERYSQYEFFFALRHFDKNYYKKFNMPSNVHLFYQEYTCYDILKSCDMHCTVYSTCAMESVSFNKKSILINIDEMASNLFADTKSKNIYIANNEKEFLEAMQRVFIAEENIYYTSDYEKNILKFIRRLEQSDR